MPYQGNDSSTVFNVRKANQQLALLHAAITQDHHPLSGLRLAPDPRDDHRGVPRDADWQPATIGTRWHGRDAYYWLQFDLPALQANTVVTLDLGRTGDGNNDGFEGLVYFGDRPRQAVDSNHESLFLTPQDVPAPLTVSICMWSGLEGGCPKRTQHFQLKRATIGPEHASLRTAYTYLWNIIDLIPELSDNDPLKYDYVRLVRNCFARFFWATDDLLALTAHADAALADIHAFSAAHAGQKLGFDVAAIGQTHIDVAWLWRYRHTAEKATRSFATALQLMREFPAFKFFYSTPQVHQFIAQREPEMFAEIKAQAAAGRWEADGATWVEPDTNLPSGESLTRQFLLGTAYFKAHFNAKQTVLWLPDVFGYSAALPQIMQGFGIHDFVTSKISWNDTNRAPHDTFVWRGLDGSEVLTYFLTTTEVVYDYSKAEMFKYTYNGEITPRVVLQTYRAYRDKQLNNHLLMPYGFGDGGGGPTREMIQNIAVIDELPGMPHIANTRVDDFFTALRHQVAATGEAYPTWTGELYLEYHRGTYTSQAFVKRANRQLEFALASLELLLTTRHVFAHQPYPQAAVNQLWQTLLKTQFHDVLPGSSIGEVYTDVHADLQTMHAGIAALRADQPDAPLTVTNPNATLAQGELTLTAPRPGTYTLPDGTAATTWRVGEQVHLRLPLAPLASTQLTFTPATEPTPVALTTHQLTTPHYALTWNDAGQLTRLFDRDHQREVLTPGGLGNRLTIYEDRPMNFDNWNLDEDYVAKSRPLTATRVTATRQGPTTIITSDYHFHQSTITQRLVVADDSRRLNFVTEADWHEHELLLRTAFDLDVQTDYATYDIQYGNVRRTLARNTSWDTAKFEVVGHKWADLSQPDYGVALLNDCKYGYAASDHSLSLSLIKAGVYPDPDADQGVHAFTYSLFPHAGTAQTGGVEQAALQLNAPLTVTRTADPLPALFKLRDATGVTVDAIKLSKDQRAVILRLHDFTGATQTVTVTPQFGPTAASLVRLDETPLTALPDPSQVSLTVAPYQIVTVAFTL
ncbi:alpha-mannosidase [Lacticaseibacillus absianus]|uniref:alpha-mannosidase n=1 Tax=Lacticaseibacillus absianus TaxID=2729623 RepID=UPI0015CA914E|nr:glycoside hydrolase family 38 C-terminal domain-containing protein [Lacticaseibacillus absianus]